MILHPKFIFLQMPKTACTSIEYFLADAVPDTKAGQTKHISAHHIELWMFSVFKFGFIRNPYDWYVSWWASSDTKRSFKEWMCKEESIRLNDAELLGIGDYEGYSLMALSFILCYIATIGKQRCIVANKIFKFEDGIANQIENIFEKYIFKLNRKQKDKLYSMEKLNTSNHLPYREYYDDELIERVKMQEPWILKTFDYEF